MLAPQSPMKDLSRFAVRAWCGKEPRLEQPPKAGLTAIEREWAGSGRRLTSTRFKSSGIITA